MQLFAGASSLSILSKSERKQLTSSTRFICLEIKVQPSTFLRCHFNLAIEPGNPALVSSKADLQKLMDASQGNYKYQVEDYFKTPKSSNFSLSPTGKLLAYKEISNKNSNIQKSGKSITNKFKI